MSGYTKGPWEVREDDAHMVTMPEKAAMGDGHKYAVCGGGNCEANANLISAAPDMYEELRASTNRLMALVLSGYITDEATKSNVQTQISFNNKAIAKAEGKEQ